MSARWTAHHKIALLSFAAAVLWTMSPAAFAQDRIFGWHTNLGDAQAAARTSGKPIFLVFRCVQ